MRNKLTVLFPILARYPTEKAYGVTTKYTAEAIQNLGFDTFILTPKPGLHQYSKVPTVALGNFLYHLVMNDRISMLKNLRFSAFQVYFYLTILVKYRFQGNVYWTRDLLISFLLSLQKSNVVICEVHRTPSFLNMILLNILKAKKNVLIAPITLSLREKLGVDLERSVIAPMSINRIEIENNLRKFPYKQKNIIYVGNFISGGYKLDLNLINNLAININKLYPEWKFVIIGIKKNVIENVCSESISPNIIIYERLERKVLMEKLALSSIGLVIYPNYKYFIDSFPIKIVEYASAQTAIIASDTIAHRSLLNTDTCAFFSTDSESSLLSTVRLVIDDFKLREKISKNAFNWARELTYDNRVKNVIDKLKTLG